MFDSIFENTMAALSYGEGMLCLSVAVGIGLVIALTAMWCEEHTKSMILSLVFLPAIVAVVIIMVNGNLGTGVAIAGAFSLVRFRSVPGKAMDICMIFLAMAMGLAVGIGYLTFAASATAFLCVIILILYKSGFGNRRKGYKTWNITVPENLGYTKAFDEVFAEHKVTANLVNVKTANMGSVYNLTYEITVTDQEREKALIDAVRCRNGNLPVSVGIACDHTEIL